MVVFALPNGWEKSRPPTPCVHAGRCTTMPELDQTNIRKRLAACTARAVIIVLQFELEVSVLITPVVHQPNGGKRLRQLANTGFGVLTNHPLSQDLLNAICMLNGMVSFRVKRRKIIPMIHKIRRLFFSNSVGDCEGFTKRDLKEFYHVYP